MPTRYRQIYPFWGVYAGRSPCTGFHYFDYNDSPKADSSLTFFDTNGLSQIDRVQSVGYGFSIERENIKQLGTRGLVSRPIVNRPNVQLSIDYLIASVRNESKLGLVVNYQNVTGDLAFEGERCCFQNLTGWNTDAKNLFVAVTPNNEDLNNNIKDFDNPNANIDPSSLSVFGFGNCYLNSYKISASVGSFPVASVGFICDNVMAYSSGSGVNIPAVLPKTGNLVPNVKFTIPRNTSIYNPSVIRPKDISLQILENNFTTTPSGALFGESSSGIPIQSFDMSVTLERQDLRAIGYVLPVDRRVNFPILADFNFSSIIADNYSGSLIEILDQNKSYDILINMYNPSCLFTGREIAIQYKIRNAKLKDTNYNYSIGPNLIANFGFNAEIDISAEKGMFISGSLNIPSTDNYLNNFLLLGNNATGFLFIENNDLLIVSENNIE